MTRGRALKVATAAALAVLALFAAGVFLPGTRTVERAASISAWPATVYALIEDARRAAEWSPWPEGSVELRFSGPPAGLGAAFTWQGEAPGSQRIVAAERASHLVAAIELGGRAGTSRFELLPLEDGTRVTWRLELDLGNDPGARWAALFRGHALEERLERGLVALATLAENLPAADFGDLAVDSLTLEAMPVAWRRIRTRPEPAAVSRALGDAFFEILGFLRRNGLSEAGPPLSVTRAFSGPELTLDAGIPVRGATDATPAAQGGIRLAPSYAGPAIRVMHRGSYATLAGTHRKIAAWLTAYGIERGGDPFEVYASDPARTHEAERVTLIYYPVQPRDGSSRSGR